MMRDWILERVRRVWFWVIWHDPILRLRCAWHVLRGRPLAYRLASEWTLVSNADDTWIIEVNVQPRSADRPDGGIVAGGNRLRIIRCHVRGA